MKNNPHVLLILERVNAILNMADCNDRLISKRLYKSIHKLFDKLNSYWHMYPPKPWKDMES